MHLVCIRITSQQTLYCHDNIITRTTTCSPLSSHYYHSNTTDPQVTSNKTTMMMLQRYRWYREARLRIPIAGLDILLYSHDVFSSDVDSMGAEIHYINMSSALAALSRRRTRMFIRVDKRLWQYLPSDDFAYGQQYERCLLLVRIPTTRSAILF